MILKCLKDHRLVLEPEGNIFCQHLGSVRLRYYHNISCYRNMYSQSHAVYLNALIYYERGSALRCQWFQHESLLDNIMWRFRLWMLPILQSVFIEWWLALCEHMFLLLLEATPVHLLCLHSSDSSYSSCHFWIVLSLLMNARRPHGNLLKFFGEKKTSTRPSGWSY